jgi:hypothetical protein
MKLPLMTVWLLWIAAAGTGTVALSQSSQDNSQDQRILKEDAAVRLKPALSP